MFTKRVTEQLTIYRRGFTAKLLCFIVDVIFTKMSQKLAFGLTKKSPSLDFKRSTFSPRYSNSKSVLSQKVLETTKMATIWTENLKSKLGDVLVNSKTNSLD